MYIPKHYTTTNTPEILAFMQTFSFATIVTVKDNFPTATHLPFVVSEAGGKIFLTSHFAKANPQWQELAEQNVLVIFAEPHAYISPKHYLSELNVPTWNYVAVHAYGKSRIIPDPEEAFTVLETMIDAFEKEYKPQWKSLPPDYKTRMLNGIVAFEIEVTELQAKEKLSQNKKPEERKNIIAAFENSSHSNEKQIAGFMKQKEANAATKASAG